MAARVAALVFMLTGAIDAEGQQHFDRGAALAEQREYEGASREFEASYQRDGNKEALFAWAQVERLRGSFATALALYRKFLESPDLTPSQSDAAQLNIKRCERAIDEARVAEVRRPAAEPVVVAPPPRHISPLGAVLIGGAVVALGTAATLYVLSRNDERDAQKPEGIYGDYEAAIGRARNKQRIAVGLAASSVLLGGVGLLQWLGVPSRRSRGASVWVEPGGAGVVLAGHF